MGMEPWVSWILTNRPISGAVVEFKYICCEIRHSRYSTVLYRTRLLQSSWGILSTGIDFLFKKSRFALNKFSRCAFGQLSTLDMFLATNGLYYTCIDALSRPSVQKQAGGFVYAHTLCIFYFLYITIMAMQRIVDLFFKSLQKNRLIEQQIAVYMSWIRRHHGWQMNSDENWINMFVEYTECENVEDISKESFVRFLDMIHETYPNDWAYRDAKFAILKFKRYYEARTRSFTLKPRRGVLVESEELCTESFPN